jgi:hypothetical protein
VKTIGLRTLYKEASMLTEEVLVLQDRRVIGSFKPFTKDTALDADVWPHLEEVPMDDIAKRALEPDQTKREPRGRLSKGLGPLPGEAPAEPASHDHYREFRPAPKPGDKK